MEQSISQLRHELRTPINHILSYTQLVQEDAEDLGAQSLVAFLQEIRALARQVLGLVNDLVDGSADGGQDARRTMARATLAWLLEQTQNRLAVVREEAATQCGDAMSNDLDRVASAVRRLQELVAMVDLSVTADLTPSRSPVTPSAREPDEDLRLEQAPGAVAGATVLVVDDNEPNRDALARTLVRLGYATLRAEDGERALEMLGTERVDLILLDVMMPGLNGYEVLERCKRDSRLREIPVLMISALDEIESVVRCITLGAEDYLPKPFDPVLLRARVGACLEKKRLRDQELDYLEQVGSVTAAAAAVESQTFTPDSLAHVAARSDKLGQLARVFQRMAGEVVAREDRHQALAQMVAGVAHEINTPLGIINTANSILRRELASERIGGVLQSHGAKDDLDDLADTLQLMSSNIDRMHRLIQTFKNMSISQIVDTLERFDLGQLTTESMDLYRVSAREARLAIEIRDQLPEGKRIWLGYRGYFSQVLLNLLTNIERYAYPDGVGGRVEVHLDAVEDGQRPAFILTVRDFGRGIAPEDLRRVFDPFFTTGRSKGGTGLGLSIVQNIVSTALQGRITIESDPGQGTTVNVVIPQEVQSPDQVTPGAQ